jgi:hypothetical protein
LIGAVLLLCAAGATATAPIAARSSTTVGDYDARAAGTVAYPPSAAQLQAEANLRQVIPDLRVTYDARTGVARTLNNMTGYLSSIVEPAPQQLGGDCEICSDPLAVAMDFVTEHRILLGLSLEDLASYQVTDEVYTEIAKAHHLYLRQVYQGLALYNAQLQVNLADDCRVLSINNQFAPDLAASVNTVSPGIKARDAVYQAALSIGIPLEDPPDEEPVGDAPDQPTLVDNGGISQDKILARLMLLPYARNDVRLVWHFQIRTLDDRHWYDLTVDSLNAKLMTRFDWISTDTYTVYPLPVESPNHTTPLPPADARTAEVDPADTTASPYAWHDVDGVPGADATITTGNNVHAYKSGTAEPDCGATIDCTFPMDLSQNPPTFTDASVVNLFYWNNIIHDVMFQYGFDSPGGNFQENTYGAGGVGGDPVQARAQNSIWCNATFGTPPDGSSGTMNMYICNTDTCTGPPADPMRDGALDDLVIVHEYGHGIAKRIVGGPGNTSCLNNTQQPGEGISDWYGMVFTHAPGAAGTDARGVGTYLFCEDANGPGIRTLPYSTDNAINDWTYESIQGFSGSHSIGQVWGQAAWEVYWALVDHHGYDSDIYNAIGGSGNQRALFYFTEGLKNTPCQPTFADYRDAIIGAAVGAPYDGEDVCLLWEAFAGFGLGTDADDDNPWGKNVTNGFSYPAGCEWDVFIEDTPYNWTGPPDEGYEPDPNMAGASMWLSRDIWVRNLQDGGTTHQNPEFGQTNYIYVNLHNYGPNVDPPEVATGELQVYWAHASSGLSWPSDWTLAGTQTIVNFPAGDDLTVNVAWSDIPSVGHYCLLAIWTAIQDPLAVPLGSSMDSNVRNNNNVAWRNVNVVDLVEDLVQQVELLVMNPHPQAATIDLVIRTGAAADGERFLDRGEVLIDLGPDLFAAWDAERRICATRSSDYEIVADDRGTNLIKPLNAVESLVPCLPLDLNKPRKITLTFRGDPTAARKTFHVEVVQFVDCLEIGGVAYQVHDGAMVVEEVPGTVED